MAVTIRQLCTAVENTLSAAVGIAKSQNFDELTEDFQDFPLLRCVPASGSTDRDSTQTDRLTFRGGSRHSETIIRADLVCRQRSHLDEDYAKVVDMAEAVDDVLVAQKTKPFFGEASIQSFHWDWEIIDYTGPGEVHYLGVRFNIILGVF